MSKRKRMRYPKLAINEEGVVLKQITPLSAHLLTAILRSGESKENSAMVFGLGPADEILFCPPTREVFYKRSPMMRSEHCYRKFESQETFKNFMQEQIDLIAHDFSSRVHDL